MSGSDARLVTNPGRRFGRIIEHHSVLDSTNRRALELVQQGAAEGTVVMADRQTAGRGRLGRAWHSPGGNLYVSVILRPGREAAALLLIPLVAAVAAHRALETTGLRCGLKWPNDVLAGAPPRKICGILAEVRGATQVPEALILGVGFNLSMRGDEVPPGLRGLATSCLLELGRPVDRSQVLEEFLGGLEQEYDAWRAGQSLEVLREWKRRSWTLGNTVRFERAGQEMEGVAVDLGDAGELIVETDAGLVSLSTGEVSLVTRL